MTTFTPALPTSTTLDAPRLNAQLELAKWLAIVTMAIDHFGFLLAPNFEIFRLAGRISLPLFLFVIAIRLAQKIDRAEGYLIRLSLWAILSQLPFWLAFLAKSHPHNPVYQLNIMATLAIGTTLTILADHMEENGLKVQMICWPFALALLILASRCDYGAFGAVAIPTLVYLARRSPVYAAVGCGILAALANANILWGHQQLVGWVVFAAFGSAIAYRCLSTTATPWRLPGLFFYAFYPAHILLLLVLKNILM